MAYTIEQLNFAYQEHKENFRYLNLQAVLGSEADVARAYDQDGVFHCIQWFDCQFCPAFNPLYCL